MASLRLRLEAFCCAEFDTCRLSLHLTSDYIVAMVAASPPTSSPPAPPTPRLCLGVTGHRDNIPAYQANRAAVETALNHLFDAIAAILVRGDIVPTPAAPVRLHTLLTDGVDLVAAAASVARGWELVAPLPFGRALNLAINSHPAGIADVEAMLAGEPATDPATEARAARIRQWYAQARLFELAEEDAAIADHLRRTLEAPDDLDRAHTFSAHASDRVALAGRVMIEQSDLLIAVWDGATQSRVGGTGHTMATALAMGTPVIRIDPANPQAWTILLAPESMRGVPPPDDREAALARLIRPALAPDGDTLPRGAEALGKEAWHDRSSALWSGYRRIETMFGGEGQPLRSLRQSYETPEAIAEGSAAAMLADMRALPGLEPGFTAGIEAAILRRFAWADGISTHLSDAYRGGMIANFVLSALAVAAGIAYQPFAGDTWKWVFSLTEFLLLVTILAITWQGTRRRWHGRWFETRRVAEYLRHAPILKALGVARPTGRWPKGIQTSWPEYYARAALREQGLPRLAVTTDYLRKAASALLDGHVVEQRDYHVAKARRLSHVHHLLDRVSQRMFLLAVLSVASYLLLKGAAALHLAPESWPHAASKPFTFLGVLFPTLGAAIAGIRYFGDFERFAAISEVTAEKLDSVHERISLLLAAPDGRLAYATVSDLAHAMDDIVVSEIENWQAVFGGKHITVPV